MAERDELVDLIVEEFFVIELGETMVPALEARRTFARERDAGSQRYLTLRHQTMSVLSACRKLGLLPAVHSALGSPI